MMKNRFLKFLSLILSIAIVFGLWCSGLSSFGVLEASAAKEGDFYYTISNKEVTITACSKTYGTVTIPQYIGVYPVVEIGTDAFFDSDITEVVMPEGLKRIGDYAFSLCKNLLEINIPETVSEIGREAFSDCYDVESITIPKSVKKIGGQAFVNLFELNNVYFTGSISDWCNIEFDNGGSNPSCNMFITDINFYFDGSLLSGNVTIPEGTTMINDFSFDNFDDVKSVNIPSSVSFIGKNFSSCRYLEKIIVDDTNPYYYTDEHGVLYNEAKNELLAFPCSNKATSYEILSGVKTINEYVFELCSNLTHITIPDTVESIEMFAFYDCQNLKTIKIGRGVTYIGEIAFYECNKLETVYYGGSEAEWENIEISDGNTELLNAEIIFLDEGHVHNYTSTIITAATCTKTGVKTFTCSCGDKYTESIPVLEHTYSKVTVTKAPTCTEAGIKTFSCVCGDSYTETIPVVDHKAGAWTVTIEPTINAEGKKVKKCTVCKAVLEEEKIPKLNPADFIDVSVDDVTVNYKSTMALNAEFGMLDGVDYTVEYATSNVDVAAVDENGNITAKGIGETEITVTVTDEFGNKAEDTCKVNVSYAWWQWLIIIFLFGWIWY